MINYIIYIITLKILLNYFDRFYFDFRLHRPIVIIFLLTLSVSNIDFTLGSSTVYETHYHVDWLKLEVDPELSQSEICYSYKSDNLEFH
jgi:hypothetical protein